MLICHLQLQTMLLKEKPLGCRGEAKLCPQVLCRDALVARATDGADFQGRWGQRGLGRRSGLFLLDHRRKKCWA